MIPTLIGITLLVFLVMALSPAASPGRCSARRGRCDPAARGHRKEYLDRRYGLDKPLLVQYLRWLHASRRSVSDLPAGRPRRRAGARHDAERPPQKPPSRRQRPHPSPSTPATIKRDSRIQDPGPWARASCASAGSARDPAKRFRSRCSSTSSPIPTRLRYRGHRRHLRRPTPRQASDVASGTVLLAIVVHPGDVDRRHGDRVPGQPGRHRAVSHRAAERTRRRSGRSCRLGRATASSAAGCSIVSGTWCCRWSA